MDRTKFNCPWATPTLGSGFFNLQVAAGRWIVLAFLDRADSRTMDDELDELFRNAHFDEDRVIFCGIVRAPQSVLENFAKQTGQAISFVADPDGMISRSFGAADKPRLFVLDPMLRAVANIPWDESGAHIKTACELIRGLPDVDNSAGVPLTAPVLIVPRVLDFPLCETLVRVFGEVGGEDSGFLVDVDGKTARMIDHRLKCRSDLVVVHPVLKMSADGALNWKNRSMARMRRRTTWLRMASRNQDYEGGDLVFPEFGRRPYRAPMGGAVVSSCGALHQVMPVTKGRRLYGETDAALREANNAKLHGNAAHYVPGSDLLFSEPGAGAASAAG
jgi:peroxiredoxin